MDPKSIQPVKDTRRPEDFEYIERPTNCCWSSIQTFQGQFFRISTGDKVSCMRVLATLPAFSEMEVLFRGEVKITDEDLCWRIATHRGITNEAVKALVQDAFRDGERSKLREVKLMFEIPE